MAPLKRYVLFAGINGVGKSTFYQSGNWNKEGIPANCIRVNSDEILKENKDHWDNKKSQVKAGKQAIRLIKNCLAEGLSFNQETTLTGHFIMQTIKQAHELGYYITLYYIGIDDPEIANARIAHRKSLGGHGIDPALVRRRALASFENLVLAIPVCDEVFLFDNTHLMQSIAKIERGDLTSYKIETSRTSWSDTLMMRLVVQGK